MMAKFFFIILLLVFPVSAVELEYLLDKVYSSDSAKEVVEPSQEKKECILDRIYTAGCYVSLSYVYSEFHPDTEETVTHTDTLKLLHAHKEHFIEVFDNKKRPNIGAIVIPIEKKVIVIFNGTNFSKKTEVLVNFDSDLTPYLHAPGLYHAGFLKLGNAIIPKIVEVLNDLYGKDFFSRCELNIYGHSRGGAIAQLLTQYLQHVHTDFDIETIIFGSPKVMCPVAANAYNKQNKNQTLRVENPLDPAIYMPTQFMGYGVVNHPVLLSNTHKEMSKNHELLGYLDSISFTRLQFRNHGIFFVSLKEYNAASSKFNPLYTWTPTNVLSNSRWHATSEFMHLLGHGLSKAIQSMIRALPFKF